MIKSLVADLNLDKAVLQHALKGKLRRLIVSVPWCSKDVPHASMLIRSET